jgi:hypothetical protein
VTTSVQKYEWCHALTNDAKCCGVSSTLYVECDCHPEEFFFRITEGPEFFTIMCAACDTLTLLRYVRSWDHHPSREEQALVGLCELS